MKISLTTVNSLNSITIAAPCPASWDKMNGDQHVRHCDQCEQYVYNVSEMSAAAAVELIQQKEGRLCVRLYRRTDGTVITSDCPVGVQWKIWMWLRKRRAWAAALFAILFLPACGMGMPRRPDMPINLNSPLLDETARKAPAPTEQNKNEKGNPGDRKTD